MDRPAAKTSRSSNKRRADGSLLPVASTHTKTEPTRSSDRQITAGGAHRTAPAKMESFGDVNLETSKSTVLNWWDPEASIECIACASGASGDYADVSLHQNQDGKISSSLGADRESSSSSEENDDKEAPNQGLTRTVLSVLRMNKGVHLLVDPSSGLPFDDDISIASTSTAAQVDKHSTSKGPNSSSAASRNKRNESRTRPLNAAKMNTRGSIADINHIDEDDLIEKLQKRPNKSRAISRSTAATANNSSTCSLTSDERQKRKQQQKECNGNRRNGCLSLAAKWEGCVKRIGDAIAQVLTALALVAARNPYPCILFTIVLSFVMVAMGLKTNFYLVLSNFELWPPKTSPSVEQTNWYYYQSDYSYEYRYIDMVVHAQGNNVLTVDGVSHVMDAMNVIQSMPNYQDGCHWAKVIGDSNRVGQCHVYSVTNFWNHSWSTWHEQSTTLTDQDILQAVSVSHYPTTGMAVDISRILGNIRYDTTTTTNTSTALTGAQSFLIEFDLPWSGQTPDFELEALTRLFELQEEWESDTTNIFRLEVNAYRSYEDEFLRAILVDLPLLPAVFGIMVLFCCLVFWRYDKVHSRSLLGVGAVVTIVLSIMTSHGLLFLCGIPFTTSTTMLPFLMFGKSKRKRSYMCCLY